MRRIRGLHLAIVLSAVVGLAATGGVAQAAGGSAPQAAVSGWTTAPAPKPTPPNGEFDVLSCPTSSWCMAVGSYVRPDGRQLPGAVERPATGWVRTAMPVPPQVRSVAYLVASCSGPAHCLAVFGVNPDYNDNPQSWLVESWNGHRWQVIRHVPWSSSASISAVVCADPHRCLVTTYRSPAFVRTATGWHQVHVPLSKMTWVEHAACAARDRCMLAALASRNRLVIVRWDGTHFSPPHATPFRTRHRLAIDDISCRGGHACVVVGMTYGDYPTPAHPFAVRWNGHRWTRMTVPASVRGELFSVSCSPHAGCFFAGFATPFGEYGVHPFLLHQLGSHWTSSAGRGVDLACAGARFCAMSVPGNGGWSISTWTSSGWHAAHVPQPAGYQQTTLTAISCVAAACEAVGIAGRKIVFDQLTNDGWRLQQVVPALWNAQVSLSCGTATDCWVAGADSPTGDDPLLYHYDGTSWTPQSVPAGFSSFDGISCAGTTFCAALGDGGAMLWDGTQWTVNDTLPTDFTAKQISCPSATFCMAVGDTGSGGNGLWWNGSTWTATHGPSLDAVSCVSETFCMAVGPSASGSSADPDVVAVWDGSAWTSLTYPAPASSWTLHGVSCDPANTCTIAGQLQSAGRPHAFSDTLTGTTWTVRTTAGGFGTDFNAVDCPEAGTCHAVGDGIEYQPVPLVGVLHY